MKITIKKLTSLELMKRKRGSWGSIKPVEKVIHSKKKKSRQELKRELRNQENI